MNGSKEVILCVDDDPEIVSALRDLLEVHGYEVLAACDGSEAFKAFDNAVDAVILDYQMPGEDGMALAARMKESKPHVPILMFSGYDNLSSWELTSVDQFVSKSGPPSQLLAALEHLLAVRYPPFQRWFGDWKNRIHKTGLNGWGTRS
ncbi:MAG TPA: response regulator [Terriglobales bacterium]|nr:response regulator [Terriglobales bacterium]